MKTLNLMKKITLLLICLIGLTGFMQAQELQSSSQLGDLLNRHNQVQDYAGSVSDYFTKEEQLILHNYLVSYQNVKLPAAYFNNPAAAVGENTGIVCSSERNTEVVVPFTGTYYKVKSSSSSNMIYDNGPYFNVAGTPDLSVVEDISLGIGTFGFGTDFNKSQSIADDVTLTADYDVSSIDVFAYQTAATVPSITEVYLQVWDGDPSGSGSSVIWGDLTTNILDNATQSNTFRVLESDPGNTDREIQKVSANTTGLSLTAGTYWIEYSFKGSGSSGPWAPPIVILGETTTGNGLQNINGTWSVLEDQGPQGLPFVMYGDLVSGGGSTMVYAIENNSAMFGTFDPTSPDVFSPIGTSDVDVTNNFENAGAVDPNDQNTVYVLDNGNNFFSVNATTGAYTSLGSIVAPNGESWAGMEYDLTDGTLYGISNNIGATSTLSVIDPAAMTATPVGGDGAVGITAAIALAIDGSGIVYAHDITEDAIYTIDKTTGVGTLLGATDFEANFGQGMHYDPNTDMIYLTAFNATSFESELRSMDTATGATTLVGGMDTGAGEQFAWSSAPGELLGVKENALEKFTYYPNPTSGMLSLESVNNIDSVVVFNLMGQQVISTTLGDTSGQIDLSGLSTGTYIMKVSADGQIDTFKIVKN